VVKVLEGKGYELVQKNHNGVWRFSVRTPYENTLTPHSQDRAIQCRVDGKKRYFNVMNLLASVLMGIDVTNNEYAILVVKGGMYVESKQDRERLRDEREDLIEDLPRVDLKIIHRPKSETMDVRGRGYYVKGGKIYDKDDKALAVDKRDGRCRMTGTGPRGTTQFHVHVGWVLFIAYPEFYGFDADVHEEVDHIDGDYKNNAANNFRPVTTSQNCALSHRTGSRVERPGPASSYEKCKRMFGTSLSKEMTDRMIEAEELKRYEMTSYWVHRLGTVFVRQSDETFRYAAASVLRNGYVVSGGHRHHLMVMKVFGNYIEGMVVMHWKDKKQDNRLENLSMGTRAENAQYCSMAMTVQNLDGTRQSFPSQAEAARVLGIDVSSLVKNGKRNRKSPELCYSETREGVKVAVVRTSPRLRPPPVKRARNPARGKQEEDTGGDAAPPPQKLRKSSSGRTIKPTTR
jgi:hypothetical protein